MKFLQEELRKQPQTSGVARKGEYPRVVRSQRLSSRKEVKVKVVSRRQESKSKGLSSMRRWIDDVISSRDFRVITWKISTNISSNADR